MSRWQELLLMAAMLLVACWAGVRVLLAQPHQERLCPEACHCICPECP